MNCRLGVYMRVCILTDVFFLGCVGVEGNDGFVVHWLAVCGSLRDRCEYKGRACVLLLSFFLEYMLDLLNGKLEK